MNKKLSIEEINDRKTVKSKLTAIEYISSIREPSGLLKSVVIASCDCGNNTKAVVADLIRGKKLSCGCISRGRKTKIKDKRLHSIWYDMIRRCNDTKNKYYGAKGVKVCEEWINYDIFKEWAYLNEYDKTKQIDKDIKGNGLLYSPATCIFVSNYDNVCNRSTSKKYIYKGNMVTLSQIAKEEQIEYTKLKARVYGSCKSIDEAILMGR